jgi:hypothetical protein
MSSATFKVDDLKEFLKVSNDDLDNVLLVYQAAAEVYFTNAGVTKDYTNPLYKVAVTVLVGLILENPNLMITGTISNDVKGITLNAIVAQLRLSQVATT